MLEFLQQLLMKHADAEEKRRKALEQKQREALESTFEVVPGDRRFCIRREEAVAHLSRVLGIRVVNNRTYREVQRIAESLGWEAVRNGNRSLYRCVKRRDLGPDIALYLSRANRRDPRTGLATTKGNEIPNGVR
jgi:hypothetical protein